MVFIGGMRMMRRSMRSVPIIALLLSLARPARAAEPERPSGPPAALVDVNRLHFALGAAGVLALPGELDLWLGHVDSIAIAPVDDRDARVAGDAASFVRLRLSPALTIIDPGGFFALWRLASEVDLLRDWWMAGDGRDPLAADPRGRSDTGLVGQRLSQLHLAVAGDHLAVQLGLVRSRWGLGLVSNSGDDARVHTAESPFGVSFQGDHVVRVGLQAHPLGKGLSRPPLSVGLAFDAVVDDDTARWQDGDRAYQVVAAVQGQVDWLSLGLYAAFRTQDHHEGGTTEVSVIDLTGRLRLAHEDGLEAFVEAEVATIRGRTSLTQSAIDRGAFDVAQLGALARFGIEAGRFLGVLEVGAASADDNPFDDDQNGFAMDRDLRVGLVLFRELLLANAAVTAANVADPDYRGVPPRGHERLATSGAVRGATYVNPRVSFRLSDDLHLYGGFLYAAADGAYVDAFWSGMAGGAPRGPRNGAPATELGVEVDLGVSWRLPSPPTHAWRLKLETAWCRPGEVFDDASGAAASDIVAMWVQAGLVW
jgi:hypothetical protein